MATQALWLATSIWILVAIQQGGYPLATYSCICAHASGQHLRALHLRAREYIFVLSPSATYSVTTITIKGGPKDIKVVSCELWFRCRFHLKCLEEEEQTDDGGRVELPAIPGLHVARGLRLLAAAGIPRRVCVSKSPSNNGNGRTTFYHASTLSAIRSFPRFCKMFSESSTVIMLLPRQGELSEICLQNLWNDLMAESVVQEVKTFLSVFNTRAYRTGVASLPTCDQIIPSIVVAARLSWSRAGTRLTPAWPWQPCWTWPSPAPLASEATHSASTSTPGPGR